MDLIIDNDDYIFNFKLSKLIGLYQILDPSTTKFYNQNVYHILFVVFSIYMVSISTMLPIGLYYSMNDVIAFAFYMGSLEQFLFCTYRVLNVVYYSKNLWKCIINTSNKYLNGMIKMYLNTGRSIL